MYEDKSRESWTSPPWSKTDGIADQDYDHIVCSVCNCGMRQMIIDAGREFILHTQDRVIHWMDTHPSDPRRYEIDYVAIFWAVHWHKRHPLEFRAIHTR